MNTFNHRDWRRVVTGHKSLTTDHRLILLTLAEFADYKTGKRAHPGRVTLGERTRTSPRTVDRALSAGLALGLLAQTGSGRNSGARAWASTYDLMPVADDHSSPVTNGQSVQASGVTDHASLQTDHASPVTTYHSYISPKNTLNGASETDQASGVTRGTPSAPNSSPKASERAKPASVPEDPKCVKPEHHYGYKHVCSFAP